jgi:hypothetical protein
MTYPQTNPTQTPVNHELRNIVLLTLAVSPTLRRFVLVTSLVALIGAGAIRGINATIAIAPDTRNTVVSCVFFLTMCEGLGVITVMVSSVLAVVLRIAARDARKLWQEAGEEVWCARSSADNAISPGAHAAHSIRTGESAH